MRTINRVCAKIRNYFPEIEAQKGKFKIEDHKISLSFCNEGDYIVIEGSRHNDGIWKWTDGEIEDMTDEEFDGRISVRAVPYDFQALVDEIETWITSHDRTKTTDLASESFGGYSYSKLTNASGSVADWPDIYRERLNEWRKL